MNLVGPVRLYRAGTSNDAKSDRCSAKPLVVLGEALLAEMELVVLRSCIKARYAVACHVDYLRFFCVRV